MKTITVSIDKNSAKGYAFILSTGVSTEEYVNFKNEYKYFIQDAILSGKSKLFDLNKLPELSNDFNELKDFMSGATDILEWNRLREDTKKLFSFNLICQLDGSGFVNEIVKK